MSTEAEFRCFVGGLSWSTSQRDLEEAFRPFGNLLEAKVVVDKDTGRSKGFGFVTFSDERGMEEAIDRMHGMDLDGRSITVDKAQTRGGGGGFSRGEGGQDCFKCGQPGHWARECPNSGGGRRFSDRYGQGDRDGRGDRYGSGPGDRDGRGDRERHGGGGAGSRYGNERNGDRYGGRVNSNRDSGPRDRYSSGGPARKDGDYNRDRSGPYDREGSGRHSSGPGRNYAGSDHDSYEERH